MLRLGALFLMLVAGSSSGAEDGISGADFAALTEGRTLHFSHRGLPFGSEQYLTGRRTLWQFADGRCEAGDWWEERGLICFRYEGGPDQCWRFVPQGAGGLSAELVEGEDPGFVLDLAGRDTGPLDCAGPDLGV